MASEDASETSHGYLNVSSRPKRNTETRRAIRELKQARRALIKAAKEVDRMQGIEVVEEKDKVCYECGKVGHIKWQCRRRKKRIRNTSGEKLCYWCGQPGHFWKGCPQYQVQDQSGAGSSYQVEGMANQPLELSGDGYQGTE